MVVSGDCMLMHGLARPKSARQGRPQIDLPNEESHCVTVKVRLECAGEISAVDCLGPFCSSHNVVIICLAMHSSTYSSCKPQPEKF